MKTAKWKKSGTEDQMLQDSIYGMSIGQENQWVVAYNCVGQWKEGCEEWGMTANGNQVSSGGVGNILKL